MNAYSATPTRYSSEQLTTPEHLRSFAEGGYLYAILDACEAPTVPKKAEELGETVALSLFKGTTQEHYWAVAPYLFKVSPETLVWVLATMWAEVPGIFLLSKSDLESLWAHARRFLVVQLPDGKHWFFRYYDPRALKQYLATCDAADKRYFFGPVRAFVLPDTDNQQLFLAECPSASSMETAHEMREQSWRITSKQFSALEQGAEQEFHQRVRTFLTDHLPTQTSSLSAEALALAVAEGIVRARKYGLRGESALTAFVVMLFEVGQRFDDSVLFRKLSADPSIFPDALMRVLVDTATDQDWQEMRSLGPPHAVGHIHG